VFTNPQTEKILERFSAETEFVVFGVVTEYCVHLAAKGLLERGRKVALVSDAVETLRKEEGQKTISELTARGTRLTSTDKAIEEIKAISKN